MLYADEDPIPAKLKAVVQQVYGGADVVLEGKAKLQLGRIKRLGLEHLPICMSKTQNSVSDNPKLRGAPEGFTVTVRELLISAGAGFIVALAGDLVRMPGLGRVPQAVNVDLVDGEIIGVG
jgi:formate--tetrahydrofolate ligase